MENQERKEWFQAIGKFLRAMSRLFLTVVSVITKFIAIGMAKVSELTISLSDQLAEDA